MSNKKRKSKAQKAAKTAAKAYIDAFSFQNDPNGSYTGQPRDKDDKPVQDADDL